MMERPYCRLIEGGFSADDRGVLAFFNAMDFSKIKRFYIVDNFSTETIRGWHGHMKEEKFAIALSGAALFVVCPIDAPAKQLLTADRETVTLLSDRILWIPAKCAHGFRCLVPMTRILFFSTATLEESKADDYRWAITETELWKVKNR
jgi:dTDP-4-dehydrorhamnose 3,5-epimerase-like enzyme